MKEGILTSICTQRHWGSLLNGGPYLIKWFPWKRTETAAPADAEDQGDDNLLAGISAREVGTHALAQQINAEDTRARGFPANPSVIQEDY